MGGRWGGRIFSAISCSLILLIRTRLSSCRRGRSQVGVGGPHSRTLSLQAAAQIQAKNSSFNAEGRQRERQSYLAGHGGRRGPEVGVVKSRFGHPAGREWLSLSAMRSPYPLGPKFLSQVGLPPCPETHIPRFKSREFSVSLGGPQGAKVTFRPECSQYLPTAHPLEPTPWTLHGTLPDPRQPGEP